MCFEFRNVSPQEKSQRHVLKLANPFSFLYISFFSSTAINSFALHFFTIVRCVSMCETAMCAKQCMRQDKKVGSNTCRFGVWGNVRPSKNRSRKHKKMEGRNGVMSSFPRFFPHTKKRSRCGETKMGRGGPPFSLPIIYFYCRWLGKEEWE